MVRFRGVALAALAVVAVGCGGANKNKYIRKQASIDLSCSEGQVRLSTVNKAGAQFLAEACGRRAVYTYSKDQRAVRISAIEGANVPSAPVVMPPPRTGDPYAQPPPPPPPPPPSP